MDGYSGDWGLGGVLASQIWAGSTFRGIDSFHDFGDLDLRGSADVRSADFWVEDLPVTSGSRFAFFCAGVGHGV